MYEDHTCVAHKIRHHSHCHMSLTGVVLGTVLSEEGVAAVADSILAVPSIDTSDTATDCAWMYKEGVQGGCTRRVYKKSVQGGCTRRLYKEGVQRGCTRRVYKDGVQGVCRRRVYKEGVQGGCAFAPS